MKFNISGGEIMRKNMKTKGMKRMMAFLLNAMLIMGMLFATGCNSAPAVEPELLSEMESVEIKEEVVSDADADTTGETADGNDAAAEKEAANAGENTVLGEGQTKISVSVTDGEGNETLFDVYTDKATVGEALLEVGLIAGEDGQYGLYVKTVNGIVADYDVDQTYWAFYIDGEYASTGVDTTPVEEGKTYGFKVEK